MAERLPIPKTEYDSEKIPINGTLDAIAYFMIQNWGYTEDEAARTTMLLWQEQESSKEVLESSYFPTPIQEIDLDDFSTSDQPAKGMVANSRVFMNLNKAKSDIVKTLPWAFANALSKNNLLGSIVAAIFNVSKEMVGNGTIQFVPEFLSCVCMRAWDKVKGKKQTPFTVKDIMPQHEFPSDLQSPFVCELMRDDGKAHLGRATWECKNYAKENKCRMNRQQALEMLCTLEKQGILEKWEDSSGNCFFAFL